MVTSEAAVDRDVAEADPALTADTPSWGDSGVVDWELALYVDVGVFFELPPWEDMRLLDLDPPACEDTGDPLLEALPCVAGELDLELPQFKPDNSSWWRRKEKTDREVNKDNKRYTYDLQEIECKAKK